MFSRMSDRPTLPDPQSAPELFDGVLVRRVLGYIVDLAMLIAVASIIGMVGLVLGFFTFGLAWVALPVIIPIAILAYYAATLGSPMRATIGMAMMDIVLTPTRGIPLDGWRVLIHPVVFWITVWIAWPISLAFRAVHPAPADGARLCGRHAHAPPLAHGPALAGDDAP